MLGAQHLTGSVSMSRTEHIHRADDAYEYIQTSNVAQYIRTKDPKLLALATYPPQHTDSLGSSRWGHHMLLCRSHAARRKSSTPGRQM